MVLILQVVTKRLLKKYSKILSHVQFEALLV